MGFWTQARARGALLMQILKQLVWKTKSRVRTPPRTVIEPQLSEAGLGMGNQVWGVCVCEQVRLKC